jgi:hypothetical protein
VTLRLVRIFRAPDFSLVISKSTFTQIFDLMKADPAIKHMICRHYDGFHEYHGDGFRLTRFIGNALSALVWTFDPMTMTTTALFLERRTSLVQFQKFVDVLWEHRRHIHTPSVLCLVACTSAQHFFEYETKRWERETIRYIEYQTGFGPHLSSGCRTDPAGMVRKFDTTQLVRWVQAVSEAAGNVGNRVRHHAISRVLLELIRKEHENDELHRISGQTLRSYQSSLEALAVAVPTVERQISAHSEYVVYLKDRAERLSTVVSMLIAHKLKSS